MRQTLSLLFGLLAAATVAGPATASVVITSAPVSILQGQTLDIPVYITANAGENLAAFNAAFNLSTSLNGVAFDSTQPQGLPSDPNYIFFGNSSFYLAGGIGTSFFSFDTASGSPVPIPTGGPGGLLTIMRITALPTATVGSVTTLSDGGSLFTTTNPANATITYNLGSVTVAAIPEPSSLALAGVAGIVAGASALRRRLPRRS